MHIPWALPSQEQSAPSNQDAADVVTYLPFYNSIGLQLQVLQHHTVHG